MQKKLEKKMSRAAKKNRLAKAEWKEFKEPPKRLHEKEEKSVHGKKIEISSCLIILNLVFIANRLVLIMIIVFLIFIFTNLFEIS